MLGLTWKIFAREKWIIIKKLSIKKLTKHVINAGKN